MSKIKDFHHYKQSLPFKDGKSNELSRSEKVERKVIELLLSSKLSDNERESSVVWELKHSSGCCQIARILAQKRNLDIEIAETASTLHDIYVIAEGKYKDHGKLGAEIAEQILKEIGGFSEEEIVTIIQAIAHHSEKEIYSDNPYIELVKDVDVFDCSLYKNSQGYYRLHKAPNIFEEYVKRIKKVRKELGLPEDKVFR